MQAFTDNQGQAWDVIVDTTAIKRVRARLDFDLLALDNRGAMKRILGDPCLMADILYVVCEPQCAERKLTDQDFGRRLIGDPIEDATFALLEGLVDFFPKRKRVLLERALAEVRKLDSRLTDQAETMIDAAIPRLVAEAEQSALAAMERNLAPGGSGSTSGPARSA